MRTVAQRFAILSATIAAACSSAGEKGVDASDPADRVVVDASASTREALGVSSWGIRNDAASTVVRGYDATKKPVVVFEYRSAQGAATTLDATLESGTRRPTLRIEASDRAHARVIENSFEGDSDSTAVLARIVADLRSGTGRSPTQPASVRILDQASLTSGEPAKLVDGCEKLLPAAAANAAQTTTDCSQAPVADACRQGLQQAPQDQDQAKRCDAQRSCGDAVALVGGGPRATRKEALTGDGTSSVKWHVNGTDLGIPFLLGGGAVGFLFGDTFDAPGVGGPGWRSPVMLRSTSKPADGIVFDGAGYAPQIIDSPHSGCNGEFTAIPNDGVTLPGGRQIVSFMSIRNWAGLCPEQYTGQWRTNYAGLASSDDGGAHFTRAPIRFGNDDANQDPFQMQTLQLDGDYVYVYSVRAGRQNGPMMLQRVRWQSILDRGAYECWGFDGNTWDWGRPCTSIFGESDFGEPSVRKLDDCTWAMAYLEAGNIVTRTASRPEGPWSPAHVQVTGAEQPCLYGGFIHPQSTANDLHLMVSAWGDSVDTCGHGGKYGVDHFVGTL